MRVAALLALALAGSTAAQGPTPPPGARQVRIDISPAGQAIVKRYLGTRDAAVAQQVGRLQAVAQHMAALANAPRLDLARLQQLMRQQETLQAAITRRGNDRTIAMLSELSEADRLKFVRSLRDARPGAPPAR